MSRIKSVTFKQKDGIHHSKHGSDETEDLRLGTIEILYSHAMLQEFDCTRRNFFKWQATGFDPLEAPVGVSVLESAKPEPVEDIEPEIEPNIHPDDYIGQATGFQSWNFQMDEDGNLLPPLEYEPSKPEASAPSKERLSTYHGVFWLDDKWLAAIKDGEEFVILGHFDSEIAAADFYDCAAYRYIGQDAKLNYPGNQTVFVALGE